MSKFSDGLLEAAGRVVPIDELLRKAADRIEELESALEDAWTFREKSGSLRRKAEARVESLEKSLTAAQKKYREDIAERDRTHADLRRKLTAMTMELSEIGESRNAERLRSYEAGKLIRKAAQIHGTHEMVRSWAKKYPPEQYPDQRIPVAAFCGACQAFNRTLLDDTSLHYAHPCKSCGKTKVRYWTDRLKDPR